jgi:hypothetical protein
LKKTLPHMLLILCSLGLLALVTYTYGTQGLGPHKGQAEPPSQSTAGEKTAPAPPEPASGPSQTTPGERPEPAKPAKPAGSGKIASQAAIEEDRHPASSVPETDTLQTAGGNALKPVKAVVADPLPKLDYRDFIPVPMETPGGGRIKEFRRPNPEDLVPIAGTPYKLHRLAAEAYLAMVAAARDEGIKYPLLQLYDGYRTREKQERLFKEAVKKYGSEAKARRWVAKYSNHETGRAIDLYLGGSNDSAQALNGSLRELPAYKWLEKNAWKYGFYEYNEPWPGEPWHWEYNPPAN